MSSRSVEANRQPKRRYGLVFLVLTGLLIAVVAGSVFAWQRFSNPLSGVSALQLDSIVVQSAGQPLVEFEVNRQQWARLLENFQSNLVKWGSTSDPAMASIDIRFLDDRLVTVTVHATGEDPGCFRIRGVDYVGGDERWILRLIDDHRDRN